jgi:5-methylcytosine-specific restriction endonuclease McrA
MLAGMSKFDLHSTDRLEEELAWASRAIAEATSIQLELLEELDRRQVASEDGCRTMFEWVAMRLDLGTDTAKRLVRTMRRTADRPDLRLALAEGVSFDRIEALARVADPVGLWQGMDVGQIRREAALRGRLGRSDAERGPDDRFLVMQPSLDESWWSLWGGLDGHSGAIVEKVLTGMADHLTELPDEVPVDAGWRKATALVELCVSDEPVPANVTVFVDAKHADEAAGHAGVVLEAGPVVGREALEAILCDARAEVIARAGDGRYMDYGHKHRVVPSSLRRALMFEYRGVCAIDGCQSASRLEAHHIIPWSRGGRTDQDNLILLCWFHHHVVIHERGFHPYRHPDHGRIRLRAPDRPAPRATAQT